MKAPIRLLTLFLFLSASLTLPAATRNNDDSCDIAVLPAATLLLPFFEVDLNASLSAAKTTIFTVVNTSQRPQIARVTIWTDWAYPLANFNLFLTGYDVQGVNLYDVIVRGVLPGTSSNNDHGTRSLPNDANPNFKSGAAFSCAQPPAETIPASILADFRSALTAGTISSCSTRVGEVHEGAFGYVTIDLVGDCDLALPTEAAYSGDLLYDNVLTGDYAFVNPNSVTGNLAGGSPLVHIRAVPEGGLPGAVVPTNLPYTFYDRYMPSDARTMDRRQPLPSTFVSRFIQGGAGAFNTDFLIWREGVVGPTANCTDYKTNGGIAMGVTEYIRFDEHENPTAINRFVGPPPVRPLIIILPPGSNLPTSSGIYPPLSASGDIGGWMYLNLNNGGSPSYSSKNAAPRPSQNWVVTRMSAEGRFETAFDATALANGCSIAPPIDAPIGPGANSTP